MNVIYLFVLAGVGVLLFASIAIFAGFKSYMVHLRRQSIDRRQFEKVKSHKALAKLLHSSESIAWGINFFYLLTSVALGGTVLALLSKLNEAFAIDFLNAYFVLWALLSVLGVAVVAYFINTFVSKISFRYWSDLGVQNYSSPVIILAKIVFPIAWACRFLASRVLQSYGIEGEDLDPYDQTFLIGTLGSEQFPLSSQLLTIIRNTIRLPDLTVSDILLPRNQIQFLDLGDSAAENLDKAKSTGHTRFPLCKGGLDNCLGIIHIKDVFQFQGDIETLDLSKMQHQLLRFPEDTALEEALRKLMKYKIHMALAVDEFGGVIGLFTLENILEELVGNIQDEFDQEEAMITSLGKNTYRVSGLTPVHELESRFDIKVENEDVSTFGGLLTAELGRIPVKNEHLELFGWKIKITEVSEKRIIFSTIRVMKSSGD